MAMSSEPAMVRPTRFDPILMKRGAFGFRVLWNPRDLGYMTVWDGQQLIDGKPSQKETNVQALLRR